MYNMSPEEHEALNRALFNSTKLLSNVRLGENKEMYTAYVLSEESHDLLMKKFPPKYEKVIAHHITVKFGVPEGTEPPPEADIKVIGYTDSGDGIEALVVAVNGEGFKDDAWRYHITWSLNPDKYKPVDSNELIGYSNFRLRLPIPIETSPQLLG